MTDFDGLWLDMNDLESNCKDNKGECPDDSPI